MAKDWFLKSQSKRGILVFVIMGKLSMQSPLVSKQALKLTLNR